MELSTENKKHIEKFFNYNYSLSKAFENLYEYTLLQISDIVFDTGDGRIVGFKKPRERFMAYIHKKGKYFVIRLKGKDIDFIPENLENIKIELFDKPVVIEENVKDKEKVEKVDDDISIGIIKSIGEGVDYEGSAFDEEIQNAKFNYSLIENDIKTTEKSIPYPNTTPYAVGHDYDENSNLKFEKSRNEPYWKKINELKEYFDETVLYNGHLRDDNADWFLMENHKATKFINDGINELRLISSDDANYNEIFNKWKFPKKGQRILFSRNIGITNKEVNYVDIVYDESDELYSNITDLYLRNALKRNKNKGNIQSIIQTIQEKQNDIRVSDTNKSFIVQGCAGSGKTMVLLHRLRYLIHNEFINSSSYYLLLPNNSFKKFLAQSSRKFNVYEDNMFSYTDYYKYLLNDTNSPIEENEDVFSKEYLITAYSEKFVQDCYFELFDVVDNKINSLVTACEQKLEKLLEEEKNNLINENEGKIIGARKYLDKLVSPIMDLIREGVKENLSNTSNLISNLNELLQELNKEIEDREVILYNFIVQEGILSSYIENDERVERINKEIAEQQTKVDNASIFTRRAHSKKLQVLKQRYEAIIQEIKEKALKIEKDKKQEELINVSKFKNITVDELESIIAQAQIVENKIRQAESEILKIEKNIDNVFTVKLKQEITTLEQTIEFSSENDFRSIADKLIPSQQVIHNYIEKAKELYVLFSRHFSEESSFKDDFKLFVQKSKQEIDAYLYRNILAICKKKLKNLFNYYPTKHYKHYWYLALYFTYLIKGQISGKRKHVYIDEAQDLSPSELKLIHKVNDNVVMNLFGDTNQTITEYGTKDWSDISFIKEKYVLAENFRNTNQVVEFCNNRLPFKMTPIGVEMDEVETYTDIEDVLLKLSKSQTNIFIVKDEYVEQVLTNKLVQTSFQYEIYTVKRAKGLEFKEVFVFDEDMTDNQKYISYTRALIKLNIVKKSPETTKIERIEIIQDEV